MYGNEDGKACKTGGWGSCCSRIVKSTFHQLLRPQHRHQNSAHHMNGKKKVDIISWSDCIQEKCMGTKMGSMQRQWMRKLLQPHLDNHVLSIIASTTSRSKSCSLHKWKEKIPYYKLVLLYSRKMYEKWSGRACKSSGWGNCCSRITFHQLSRPQHRHQNSAHHMNGKKNVYIISWSDWILEKRMGTKMGKHAKVGAEEVAAAASWKALSINYRVHNIDIKMVLLNRKRKVYIIKLIWLYSGKMYGK